MDHGLWIDAIQQSPTAGYIDPFYLMAESMRVRESADLDNLSPADVYISPHNIPITEMPE
ncbi:hypothetical protein E4U13_008120 [Claviceps humidiphila]|uniref:Uncharacterized protein n=2 Tax=Claviceps TaxID=5110 RepID=A0A9P7TX73_9HYPO|nr:hypothetical protein E4U56_003111 [Claviceps arundinis]KAG6064395.1 hypothetical protein E4U32_000274 [Claviceps aff. humidiphila group G2b]KAG6123254.1 hypothetical protein E4U13_008120 [Claviceps humidiphila]